MGKSRKIQKNNEDISSKESAGAQSQVKSNGKPGKKLKGETRETEKISEKELKFNVADEEEVEETSGESESEESDNLDGEQNSDDDGSGDSEDFLNTDVEGFPMSEDDRDGVINLLTQIFLRNGEVGVPELADALIAQNFGLVLGPAEDESDDENANIVYGLLTAIEIDSQKEGNVPKYAKSIVDFILERSKKYASKDSAKKFEELFSNKIGFLINERMLHFPTVVVPQSFTSLRDDLDKMNKPYKHVLYIQKIRVADADTSSSVSNEPPKKKKKMGKAEKKRLAAAALANAEILFDNVEDAELFRLDKGIAYHFDYPVHQDIEPGSKFHIIEKDGKTFRPYRRAVIMDTKRFNAFIDKMTSFVE